MYLLFDLSSEASFLSHLWEILGAGAADEPVSSKARFISETNTLKSPNVK